MVLSRRVVRRSTRSNPTSRRSVSIEESPPESPRASTISPDNIHSPFYLTNGDNPGLSIISEVLDGSNYDDWKIAVTIALDAKNKLSFIDGTLTRPTETDENFRIWSRCNSMVKSWLLNSVSKQIYKSILRFNDASEIWKDLLARFHITNLPRSYQLSQQIWSLQQGSLDLSTYYTTLKTLWDELEGAECIATCRSCDCCKATSVKANQAKVIKFLAGLNESYSVIRSQIIMKKNIPELADIYKLLDQDHSQRNLLPVTNASAFQVSSGDSTMVAVNAAHSVYPKQSRPLCSHCGYTGHTVERCYKVHGYPTGFKHKQKITSEKSQPASSRPVVAQISLPPASSAEAVSTALNCLSKDQIQGVIAYFNSQLSTKDAPVPVASSSGATITALPGSYQGIDDWTG